MTKIRRLGWPGTRWEEEGSQEDRLTVGEETGCNWLRTDARWTFMVAKLNVHVPVLLPALFHSMRSSLGSTSISQSYVPRSATSAIVLNASFIFQPYQNSCPSVQPIITQSTTPRHFHTGYTLAGRYLWTVNLWNNAVSATWKLTATNTR
jgi:hypothetical protein